MRKLTQADVIKLIREEYDRQLENLLGELDSSGYEGQEDQDNVISVGLKVRHNKSNFRYTVQKVGLQDILLRTPEGETFVVTRDELEKEYKLD